MNVWAIPAFTSILGTLQGIDAGKDAEAYGRQERLMAEENALLEKRDLQEQVRRQENADRKVRSTALARAAASGARLEGTPASHITYLATEQARELDWMKTAGASRIRLNLQAGRLRADATIRAGKNQQYSAFFGGVTTAFSFADKGGMFTTAKTLPSNHTSKSWTPQITGPK